MACGHPGADSRVPGFAPRLKRGNLPLPEEILQVLIGRMNPPFRAWRSAPSGSYLVEGTPFRLGRLTTRRHGTGRRCVTDSRAVVRIENVVYEPSQVPAVESVDMLPFVKVRYGVTVPEEDAAMVVVMEIGYRISMRIKKSSIHRTPHMYPGFPLQCMIEATGASPCSAFIRKRTLPGNPKTLMIGTT
jgi:hypothetical protein